VQLLPHVHVAPAEHWTVQFPLEQDAVHVDPDAQSVEQSPLVHVTLHEPPDGHVVWQSPLSHVIVHWPAPHVLLQLPLRQSSEQAPCDGQTMSQLALLHAQ
jgi:hypothetical protein